MAESELKLGFEPQLKMKFESNALEEEEIR